MHNLNGKSELLRGVRQTSQHSLQDLRLDDILFAVKNESFSAPRFPLMDFNDILSNASGG